MLNRIVVSYYTHVLFSWLSWVFGLFEFFPESYYLVLFHPKSPVSHASPIVVNYASPSSGEAYRDRQLTTNFELWVEIFCVPTCFHNMRIQKPCLCPSVRLSVCPYPEKRSFRGFVNISPTLVIDTSMERSSRVLHHGNQKIGCFSSKKFEIEFHFYFDLCQRAEINIQVGLNMHLYVDLGYASSSLWGCDI